MPFADRPAVEQAALRYCAPRGIPLSKFLYARVGEPDWTQEDAQAAFDWQGYEDAKCPGCGQPAIESMAHEDVSPAYEAEVKRCHACEVRRITMEESDAGNASTLYATVRKVS